MGEARTSLSAPASTGSGAAWDTESATIAGAEAATVAAAAIGVGTAAISSAGSPITAMASPTGTGMPSCATSRCITPPVYASNSTVALSVSMSAITSPRVTVSPSRLCQRTTVPSRIS